MTSRPDADLAPSELIELRDLERLLRDLPPEALVEGRPEDADLVLQRTLRAVRAG